MWIQSIFSICLLKKQENSWFVISRKLDTNKWKYPHHRTVIICDLVSAGAHQTQYIPCLSNLRFMTYYHTFQHMYINNICYLQWNIINTGKPNDLLFDTGKMVQQSYSYQSMQKYVSLRRDLERILEKLCMLTKLIHPSPVFT